MGYWGASFVAALGVLFAIPSIGEDGDPCTAGSTWVGGKCTILCDDLAAGGEGGSVTCGPIILKNPIGSLAIELQTNTGCAAGGAAKIFSKSAGSATGAATAPWHYIGQIDLDATATGTTKTSLISVDGTSAAPMRWLKAEISGEGSCADGTDIVVHQR